MRKVARCICSSLLTLFMLDAGSLNAQQDESIYPAQLVSFEDLAYPGVARAARIQGIVVIRARLDDKGNVVNASPISGLSPFIADSLANIKKWKFKPSPGKSVVIVYEFKLDEGACHDDSHSLFRLMHSNFATVTACSRVIQ